MAKGLFRAAAAESEVVLGGEGAPTGSAPPAAASDLSPEPAVLAAAAPA